MVGNTASKPSQVAELRPFPVVFTCINTACSSKQWAVHKLLANQIGNETRITRQGIQIMRTFYATIREKSKYFHSQQEFDENGKPIPFKVILAFDTDPCWPVKGGIGGNYTLYDVDLWILYEENFEKLPIHQRPI